MFRPRAFSDESKKSLRHWGMEFVVVVLGVLLALWAQEWAEGRAAAKRNDEALGSLHNELKIMQVQAAQKVILDRCIAEQWDKVRDALLRGGDEWPGMAAPGSQARGERMPGPLIYPVANYAPDFIVRARDAGAFEDVPDAVRFAYDDLFYVMRVMDANTREMIDEIAALRPLGGPLQLDPSTRIEMLQHLARFDRLRLSNLRQAQGLAEGAGAVGQQLSEKDQAFIDRYSFFERERASYGDCLQGYDWKTGKAQEAVKG